MHTQMHVHACTSGQYKTLRFSVLVHENALKFGWLRAKRNFWGHGTFGGEAPKTSVELYAGNVACMAAYVFARRLLAALAWYFRF